MTTVRDAFFNFLRQVGVDTVFGNPGPAAIPLLRDWPPDFTYALGLQESLAVAMAAGHAIGTGRAGVASVHSAAGLGSLVNASRDRVPLLVIAGPQARGHEEPSRAEDVPAALAEAWRMAMTPPRGPVVLAVPEDFWGRPAAPVRARPQHTAFTAAPAALAEVAAALTGARRPALVIGAGVDADGAQEVAVELAERVSAAVWITPLSARSGFPETHRLFQGFLPSVPDEATRTLDGHDVVVSAGGDGPSAPPGTKLFHLDCDPVAAARAPNGTTVLTTAREGLTVLLDLVEKRYRPEPPPRERPAPAPPEDRVTAAFAFDTLQSMLPERTVVVAEMPSHREEFHARFPITRPGGFLSTGGSVPGWGLPLAVGRALAGRERVVCLVGDGSSVHSIQAIWTAVRYRAPVTVVVLNNHGYQSINKLGLHRIDFVTLANGLGCYGTSVAHPAKLAGALAHALSIDGPYLVEIPLPRGAPAGQA